jgi:SAM-dependent methyltransferase/uncharacterized damage-inducible protein DinB
MHQLKARLRATWMTGDYDVFSRYMEPDAHLFFRRIGVEPGQKVLDVGCGTGQLALIAARAGAEVTGCDIATNSLERARLRASREQLNATFDEGDAEDLPYADAQFDVVASLVGAMFAPRPDRVASELVRVCKPGGKIAMANWTPQGFVGQMFKIIARYIAPNGMPSPVLWGDQATVHERFREGVLDLRCTYRFYQFEYPFPPDVVVDFFREHYGPMSRAFGALDAEGQAQLKADLVALWSAHNRGDGNATLVDAEYLEVIAIRGNKVTEIGATRDRQPQSRRAELLADRIEEGAARLADFASRLSDSDWSTPINEGGKQGRTAGVIINHVASIYPVELSVAEAVAAGKSVTDVTWDVVAEINAKHASENANTGQAETVELLRKNSREVADAVRNLSDDELDRAAPFSLSSGAPMTAQFVLEDHAVRHSWHHRARLRNALGHRTVNPTSQLR